MHGEIPACGIDRWLHERRTASGLEVQRIPFAACAGWRLEDGVLAHRTGRFFSVRGIRCTGDSAHIDGLHMPIIDQPEVGILGFVVRPGPAGWEWLLQAKTEPGSVGGTQVGPTVQATESNYCRVHGGNPTPMLELFLGASGPARRLLDVEQSEQGDRFLGKYNRNAVVCVDGRFAAPDSDSWRWFTGADLRRALLVDYSVNTDARSVLTCSDWSCLLEPGQTAPFARWISRDGFGEQLHRSYAADKDGSHERNALTQLAVARKAAALAVQPVPLDALDGWRWEDEGLVAAHPGSAGIELRAYAVAARDREVAAWCQPMVVSRELQRNVLLCSEIDGVLQFGLDISIEPGFREKAQFGPSWVSGLGHRPRHAITACVDGNTPGTVRHATVTQSDEGGRFMNATARYEIIEIAPDARAAVAADLAWLPLSSIHRMATTRGLLNNELRSVLSLLLHWA